MPMYWRKRSDRNSVITANWIDDDVSQYMLNAYSLFLGL